MRCIRVTLASATGKGMKLSLCCCLCGLHFSLVFKPHIVPDLLPIAGSKLIMQLLLIKQRRYIFISIRLLIPQYFFEKKRQCFAGAMEEAVRWDGVGDAFSPACLSLAEPAPLTFFSLGDSCNELALGSSSTSPSAFLLPGSAELKGGIPKAIPESLEHCHCGETRAVRDGEELNSSGWVWQERLHALLHFI